MVKPAATRARKKAKKVVSEGIAHVHASFNNTHITITDTEGHVIAWSSAGGIGFKGSRKGTPFAATQAAIAAGTAAKGHGLRSLEVRVKGPGHDNALVYQSAAKSLLGRAVAMSQHNPV